MAVEELRGCGGSSRFLLGIFHRPGIRQVRMHRVLSGDSGGQRESGARASEQRLERRTSWNRVGRRIGPRRNWNDFRGVAHRDALPKLFVEGGIVDSILDVKITRRAAWNRRRPGFPLLHAAHKLLMPHRLNPHY